MLSSSLLEGSMSIWTRSCGHLEVDPCVLLHGASRSDESFLLNSFFLSRLPDSVVSSLRSRVGEGARSISARRRLLPRHPMLRWPRPAKCSE